MPECPKCHANLPEGTEFCPHDGEALEGGADDLGVAATAYGPAAVHDTSPTPGAPAADAPAGAPAPAAPKRKKYTEKHTQDLVGQVIGGVYEVIELIGVGGMGEVYRVVHTNLKKEFALKVLGQVAQDHPDAVDRFRQEAVAASHIEHDNIVDIITLDATPDGHLFIVMELLKGRSLADVIRKESPLPLERALPIAYQICRALHAAHEAGIIHRDLKPENVYVMPRADAEFAKILDFGISKIHDAEHERVRITKTGHVLGTPLYMSPEQAKGESNLDRRVDIYSLGVMLYEMLEGHPPFAGDNYFQLIWKHSNETAPPMTGDAPPALQEAVLKALSKDPGDRYDTMLLFEEAISAAVPEIPPPAFLLDFRPTATSLPGRSTTVPTLPPRRRSPWLLPAVGAGALLLAAAVVIGSGAFGHRGDDPGATVDQHAVVGHAPVADAGPAPRDAGARAADARAGDEAREEAGAVAQMVKLSIESTPSGAAVFFGDEQLGVTPFTLERLASDEEVWVKVSRAGYVPQRKRFKLDHDEPTWVVELERRQAAGDSGASSIIKKGL